MGLGPIFKHRHRLTLAADAATAADADADAAARCGYILRDLNVLNIQANA